jgi:hypothetical protein
MAAIIPSLATSSSSASAWSNTSRWRRATIPSGEGDLVAQVAGGPVDIGGGI